MEEEDLRQVKKTKKSLRGHKARWPQLEDQLKQWVVEQRAANRSVSTVTVRMKATALAQDMNINNFRSGPSCFSLLAINNSTSQMLWRLTNMSDSRHESFGNSTDLLIAGRPVKDDILCESLVRGIIVLRVILLYVCG